jgi:hypothetical protein
MLTIKWSATANLLNACPCLVACGLRPPETVLNTKAGGSAFTLGSGLRHRSKPLRIAYNLKNSRIYRMQLSEIH